MIADFGSRSPGRTLPDLIVDMMRLATYSETDLRSSVPPPKPA